MFFCHLYGAFLFLNSYTSAINNPVILKHVKHDLLESYAHIKNLSVEQKPLFVI